ncbi:MAG: helix-turn-helix domain-containing protein [Bacteroidota bacterium]|nr:helix-turn-helix domain-containing protein [Bacteroidota bacterium]
MQTLHIKNMVCDRCIRVVRDELTKLRLNVASVSLGEAEVGDKPSVDIGKIRSVLEQNGFELIEDKRAKIVEKIKNTIVDLVHHSNKLEELKENYSTYIEKKVGQEYHSLSKLFSSIETITIEKFLIAQKIERVKELLVYGEFTLSEIAYKLGYSSVQHLSNQFKQITGFTPTDFRKLKQNNRKPLDKVG